MLDFVIVGGGFYGLRLALHLRKKLHFASILVLEKEDEVMERASFVNQARVHNGYHYPRSLLTAYRSRVNLPDFLKEYSDAVVDNFDHYYAIANRLSRTNARQFELFCSRIGVVCELASSDVLDWFDPNMVETAFRVKEPAFDSRILRHLVLAQIASVGGIRVSTGDAVSRVEQCPDGLRVHSKSGVYRSPRVINATYSQMNRVHAASGVPTVAVQHELAEMALVALNPPFTEVGLTVMDGPFFSLMPFPSRGLHSLSHVRYTPHHRWTEGEAVECLGDPDEVSNTLGRSTCFPKMFADVVRYVPDLHDMVYRESIWEVKTVLTKSDDDDSRPILFRPDHGMKGFTTVMGGKIDNVYDVLEELTALYA
ncbi:FAD-binding oxidoreductase [Cryobacterium sp. Hh7]|uniref:FAD-dependent oxidoreductase n=1 Tax=Cryobacterium sp. Hh7 TaxID=1259159 RepID=UPI0010692E2F|nr:FAD-dependent oxidoreductase [Cryobacterium sp. Hh7]TFD51883.1 FAD-binding oxidoreductase [Cryobacterium sp. Hh7]